MALDQRSTVLLVSIFVLVCFTQRISAQGASGWKTLSGKAPLVIARGGLSGLFPEQTMLAYLAAVNNSLSDTVMFCDLQLSKDNYGICRSNLMLQNSTNINLLSNGQANTYVVNGHNITGFFSIDYTSDVLLSQISAIQPILSRTTAFDNVYPLVQPMEVYTQFNSSTFWLNVQYSMFFEKHNLSMSSYVISLSKSMPLNYISSAEVGFLQAIAPRFRRTKTKTKLILMFLGKEDVDPSTNETYGFLLKNLTSVKTFAAGILVPKDYIWPVDSNLYLQAPSSLVQDAHSAGLEIFAADFANDEYGMSYNYSYDPIREYLQFVDNKNFAVDGFLTDFSVTASEAIACYAQNNVSTSSKAGKSPLIISHNGASGDYPGCTDIAYQAAIRDGADYIDCSVQITKDGVPICMESPDLTIGTNIVSNSIFYPSRIKTLLDINKLVADTENSNPGIFTFDLTWNEIQSLKPFIYSPFRKGANLLRNPAEANAGKYMNLSSFLGFAQSQGNVSVLINIQNARAIALARNLSVIEPTMSVLKMSGYNSMTNRIMIESSDSAVLMEFKQRTNFKLVYDVDATLVSIPESSIKEIKTFSDAVVLDRNAVFPTSDSFLMYNPDIVQQMHLQNVSVFIYQLRNEFLSLAFDYLADPTMEINTLVTVAEVDGLITDFPATASAYLGNACLNPTGTGYSMYLANPGSLESAMPPASIPPALAPAPVLSSVSEPPLPSITEASATAPVPSPTNVAAAAPHSKPSSACHSRQSLFVSFLIGLFILFLYYN